MIGVSRVGHFIFEERPDVVVNAVQGLIKATLAQVPGEFGRR